MVRDAETCRYFDPMSTAHIIPARIKAARHLAGLGSAKLLASAIDQKGLRVTRLNKLEQGREIPTPRDLDAIAQACGLPPEWFTADFSRLAEIAPGDHRRAQAQLIADHMHAAAQRQSERLEGKPPMHQLRLREDRGL